MFLEEQPEQDSVQKNPSNIPELDIQLAEYESLPEHKVNYKREESMIDILDDGDILQWFIWAT